MHIGVHRHVIEQYCHNVYRAGSQYVASDQNIFLYDIKYETLLEVLSHVYTGAYVKSGEYASAYEKLGIHVSLIPLVEVST